MAKTISDWIDELRSDDKTVKQEASRALSYMGSAAVAPLLESFTHHAVDVKLITPILSQIGEPALDSLTEMLQSSEPDDRKQAAILLAAIGDNRSVLNLVMALDDKDDSVRAIVARSLGSFADSRAVSALIDLLKDDDIAVRANSAESLGSYYRDPRVIPALISAGDDPEPVVRIGTAKAMAKVHHDKIKAKLEAMTSDENSDVRLTAAAALQHQGGDSMVFERMSVDVSDKIAEITQMMFDDDVIDEHDAELMRNSNPRIRAQLLEMAGQSNAETAVKLVLPALNDINPAVRQTAIDSLVRLGENATEQIIVALSDESRHVRAGAVQALAIVGDTRSIDPICNTAENDEAPIVRRHAITALTNFEPNDRIARVIKQGLKDSDEKVQQAATEALEKLGIDTSNPISRFFKRFSGND